MKIIPCIILSCNLPDKEELRKAQWATCLSAWQLKFPQIKCFHLIGKQLDKEFEIDFDNGVIYINCPDGYGHLPFKTYYGIKACLDNFEFDHLFKMDDDTFVFANNFNLEEYTDFDFRGYVISWNEYKGRKVRYCSGGFYSLSRRAAEKLMERKDLMLQTGAEDQLVGVALEGHYSPVHRGKELDPWSKLNVFKGIEVGHWIKTPAEFYYLHKKSTEL